MGMETTSNETASGSSSSETTQTTQAPSSIKSGLETSEFWITIASVVVGLLTSLGLFTPGGSDDLVKAFAAIIGGIATIVPAVVYIISRFKLKNEELKQKGNNTTTVSNWTTTTQ
jgi:hypothetical protein